MKRLIALLLAFSMGFGLTACGKTRASDLMQDVPSKAVDVLADMDAGAAATADFGIRLFQTSMEDGENTEPVSEETEKEPENSGAESSAPEAIPTIPDNSQEEVPGISTDPSENTISQDKEKESFRLPQWIKTVFKWLILAACVPIQAYLRIYWKQTLWNSGRPNERTLSRWRQTRSLAKLLKQPYPEDLDNLAQKAKFSQHRIQSEELQQFEDYRLSLIELINEKAWFHRMVFKWILAVD